MESIPENPMLKFNSDTMISIRKLYNLDKPGDMDKAIDLLDDWIQKQNHFTKKDYSREYLERTIIYLKGSVERSKNQVDKLCTLRTLLPVYFEKCDPNNELQILKKHYISAFLPKLTEDNYRVFAGKFISDCINSKILMNSFQMTTIGFEYLKANDYCNGFICVLDYRDLNLFDFIPRVNLFEFNQFIAITMQGYGMRIRGIHLLTPSKAGEMLINIFSKMVGAKVAKRIHVHTKIDTLYDHVPRDMLPVQFGGFEKSLVELNDEWMDLLSQKENVDYTKELKQAVTNEAYRQTDKFNEMYLGMAGTFRTLNVD